MSAGQTWVTGDYRHAAGGRRGYNATRKVQAELRRFDVATLLAKHGGGRGSQRAIAAQLGVSKSTVSRDVAAIISWSICPCCGNSYPISWRQRTEDAPTARDGEMNLLNAADLDRTTRLD